MYQPLWSFHRLAIPRSLSQPVPFYQNQFIGFLYMMNAAIRRDAGPFCMLRSFHTLGIIENAEY